MSDEPPVPPVDDDMEAQEVGTSDELVATSDSINAPEPETSTEPEPEPEPEPEAPVEPEPEPEAAPLWAARRWTTARSSHGGRRSTRFASSDPVLGRVRRSTQRLAL